MVHIKRSKKDHPHFGELVRLLDEDLMLRYGEEQEQYAAFNRIETVDAVVVAYDDSHPAGCGAFRRFSETEVEIKRMFVRPEYRGSSMSTLILRELEAWAAEQGFHATVLETGVQQPEAIRFYAKSGYSNIDNFGPYKGNPNSVCMRKTIGKTQPE